jgi:hypothetical protein
MQRERVNRSATRTSVDKQVQRINVHRGKPEPKKHAVHALVERGGEVRARMSSRSAGTRGRHWALKTQSALVAQSGVPLESG